MNVPFLVLRWFYISAEASDDEPTDVSNRASVEFLHGVAQYDPRHVAHGAVPEARITMAGAVAPIPSPLRTRPGYDLGAVAFVIVRVHINSILDLRPRVVGKFLEDLPVLRAPLVILQITAPELHTRVPSTKRQA